MQAGLGPPRPERGGGAESQRWLANLEYFDDLSPVRLAREHWIRSPQLDDHCADASKCSGGSTQCSGAVKPTDKQLHLQVTEAAVRARLGTEAVDLDLPQV